MVAGARSVAEGRLKAVADACGTAFDPCAPRLWVQAVVVVGACRGAVADVADAYRQADLGEGAESDGVAAAVEGGVSAEGAAVGACAAAVRKVQADA